jgi:hypothetical protein
VNLHVSLEGLISSVIFVKIPFLTSHRTLHALGNQSIV